jgi:Mg-chelatase subunit ChlD
MTEPISPSVCRRARRNTARSVSAVVIAGGALAAAQVAEATAREAALKAEQANSGSLVSGTQSFASHKQWAGG